jgi:hypothetical protein
MIEFYRITFVLAMLSLVLTFVDTPALPAPARFAVWMAKNPNEWDVVPSKVGENNMNWKTPAEAKDLVQKYIGMHPTDDNLTTALWISLSVILFSLIGWIRERSLVTDRSGQADQNKSA